MEEEAEKLMSEALVRPRNQTYLIDQYADARAQDKNFIDYEEYPQTADIQAKCVNMVARLFKYGAP